MDPVEKKYKELQDLEKHIKMVDQEIQKLDDKTLEIENIKKALDETKKTKKGTEVLFPLANGLFLKGKLEDNEKILVNVGSGAVVEKTIDEAKTLVEEQEKSLEEYKSNLIKNLTLADERAYEIEKEILKLTEDYK